MLTNTEEDFSCNWSPNGRYIAYTKSICDPACGIAIYDLSNDKKKVIGQYGGYTIAGMEVQIRFITIIHYIQKKLILI